jgi:hypothetical protein
MEKQQKYEQAKAFMVKHMNLSKFQEETLYHEYIECMEQYAKEKQRQLLERLKKDFEKKFDQIDAIHQFTFDPRTKGQRDILVKQLEYLEEELYKLQ